jgi:hypothetical protein
LFQRLPYLDKEKLKALFRVHEEIEDFFGVLSSYNFLSKALVPFPHDLYPS